MPTRRRIRRALIASAMCGGLIACGGGGSDAPRTFTVQYTVSGTVLNDNTSASITYRNQGGGTSQVSAAMPWQTTFTATEGDFLYVSGQRGSAQGGIAATIWVNGAQFKTSFSSGPFVIATASGTCC